MEYEQKFSKLLKKMNDNKIDWEKKNSWETTIENSINKSSFVETINECLFGVSQSNSENE
tara:strand:- start:990 stop:1169 length:180 start_codon:yes stop_codon:yes gene_type:complete